MAIETTNPAQAGSDSAMPPADDLDSIAAAWQEEEPEEANPETPDDEDEAPAAPEGEPEAEDGEEPEGLTDEAKPVELKPETAIKLPDGSVITLKELQEGNLREADYRRKTQEAATQRRGAEEGLAVADRMLKRTIEFLASKVPPKPPAETAYTNVQEYMLRMRMHEDAMADVMALVEEKETVEAAAAGMGEQQRAEMIQNENVALEAAFPVLKKPEQRARFFQRCADAALKFGFSREEIGATTNHKIFKMAHYAAIGLEVEAAKAKARPKIAAAAPLMPSARNTTASQNKLNANRKAVSRLRESGTLADALRIDFD